MNKESKRVITYSNGNCNYEEVYTTTHKDEDQIIKFVKYLGQVTLYLSLLLIFTTATIKLIQIVDSVPVPENRND